MECSKCAAMPPSRVFTVQPSDRVLILLSYWQIIGSMAMVMPGTSRGPRPGVPVVGHFGILMQLTAGAVAYELPHHTETSRLTVALHSMADISNAVARHCLGNARAVPLW